MTDRASILTELQGLVSDEFYVDTQKIVEDTRIADFGLDSISLAEFMFLIEDHFKVDVGANMRNVDTIGDVVSLIEAKRSMVVG